MTYVVLHILYYHTENVVSSRWSFEALRSQFTDTLLAKVTPPTNKISETKTDMMFLKLSLNVLLYIVVMTMAFSTNENAKIKCYNAINYPSPNNLIALHYNLHITLQESGYVSNSESNITIYINRATQNITLLHSKYMNITEVKLKSINSGKIYTPAYFVPFKKEMIFLDFELQLLIESNLECGVYTLYVKFTNKYFNLLMDSNVGKQFIDIAPTQMRGAQLFPCWVEPELCATFNISVEHSKKRKVLSNMPIQEQKPIDGDTMRTLFHMTPEMSTKDVAIMMYDVDNLHQVLNSTKTVVNTWCRPHMIPYMKFVQYVAGNVTMYLENWKILKSIPKVDYIAIPSFEDKIWQTYGLVIYNEADIIYNEELHPAAFKTVLMRSIAHDITYQRFGNLFNPSCRLHWWLNKGFIMFLETYIIDKAFPNSQMMDLFVVQIQHESRHLNTNFATSDFIEYTSNIRLNNSIFPFLQIIGAAVWRMLESIIPHNAFWTGLNIYLNLQFTYSNLRTCDDLWNLMQIEIDDLNLELNFERYNLNVKQMMDIWTIQKHCPVLNVTRDYSSGRVIISKEFHDKLDQIPYFIPVTYTKETELDFNIIVPNINSCLTQSNPELEIQFNDKDKWIIVNRQQAGYYRVNYDTENWRKIARYLNSEKYTNIHVLNRAQIIDDAFHLAIEKKLNVSIFWELASYLSREEDYVAWYPMIKVFEYISNIFAFTNTRDNLPKVLKEVLLKIESLFEHIKIRMYDQLQIALTSNLEKYLKQELAKWGCIIGNLFCMDLARNQLILHTKHPTIYKILPGSQKSIYCNGLKTADYNTWRDVWYNTSRIYKENDYKMLKFFSCSEDPEIIYNYLKFFIPTFETSEYIYISTLARHAKNTTMLTKILNNFEHIQHRRISMNAILSVIINNVYSEEQLIQIRQFAKRDMQQSLSDIEHKLRTRSLEIQNQLNFLHNLFEEPKSST